MSGARPYNQLCPVATGLDIIGTRWAMLVVRELILGPRRFSDIIRGLESTSTDILTSRLRQLESAGVVKRADGRAYALTEAGYDLAPILHALTVWVERHAKIPSTASIPDNDILVRRVMTAVALLASTRVIPGDARIYELTCNDLIAVARPLPGSNGSYRLTAKSANDAGPLSAGRAEFEFDALAAFALSQITVEEMLATGGLHADQPSEAFLKAIS